MIQGLMHVLNEVKRWDVLIKAQPGSEIRLVAALKDWLQEEIDKEIDDLAEHHSQRERAETPKDITEMTDKEWRERNDPPSQG